jgi:hypothetical protein
MASFQTLRRTAQPSASAGGLRTSWNTLVIAAVLFAAACIAALALPELATQGNHAVDSTQVSPAGDPGTLFSPSFAGTLAHAERGRS